jgi:hypothetical protein
MWVPAGVGGCRQSLHALAAPSSERVPGWWRAAEATKSGVQRKHSGGFPYTPRIRPTVEAFDNEEDATEFATRLARKMLDAQG